MEKSRLIFLASFLFSLAISIPASLGQATISSTTPICNPASASFGICSFLNTDLPSGLAKFENQVGIISNEDAMIAISQVEVERMQETETVIEENQNSQIDDGQVANIIQKNEGSISQDIKDLNKMEENSPDSKSAMDSIEADIASGTQEVAVDGGAGEIVANSGNLEGVVVDVNNNIMTTIGTDSSGGVAEIPQSTGEAPVATGGASSE